MLALLEPQRQMQAVLAHGPVALPPGLFEGAPERVILGLAVHANTISHARLVAFEESFPHTRTLLGEGPFNELTRAALDEGIGTGEPRATIGRAFPAWLEARGGPQSAVALARFELAWLEAFHAAERDALTVEALAGRDETALLSTRIAAHPATRLCTATPEIWQALGAESVAEPHVLITRPDADVAAHPASEALALLFDQLPATIETALTAMGDAYPEADLAATFSALVAAGAITTLSEPGVA